MNTFAKSTAIALAIISCLSIAVSFLQKFLGAKASNEDQCRANETVIRTVTFVTIIAMAYKLGPAVVICAIIIDRALSSTMRAYANA